MLAHWWDATDGIRNIMDIIHRVRSYFQRTYGEIHLNAHIRAIVVLTCGKLTWVI
jgi:hypothetical protein